MKRFLVWQTVMVNRKFNGTVNEVIIDTIIRNVGAKNEEEAIGKFLLKTAGIQPNAMQKLTPVCIELKNLLKLG